MAMRFVDSLNVYDLYEKARFGVMPTSSGAIRAIDVHVLTTQGDRVTYRAYSGGRVEDVPTSEMGTTVEEGGKRLDVLRAFLTEEISAAEVLNETPDTLAGFRRALEFLEQGY